MKLNQIPHMEEIPNAPPPEMLSPPPPPSQKTSRKALYSVIGIIAVVTIVVAIVFMYFLPLGGATTVPLGINYSKGEAMTYNLTMTMAVNAPGMPQYNFNETATAIIQMEVLDFDGTNYTIHYTMEMYQPTYSSSYTVTMNKTGHILNFSGLPYDVQQMYSSLTGIPGYGSYFPREQMRVGESYQIPLNLSISGVSILGNVNYRISEIANKTFLNIGQYHVFRMDVSANNIHGTGTSDDTTINIVMNLNGYAYMEYGACLLLESNIQETVSMSQMGQTMNMNLSMRMQLMEHHK